MPSPLHSRFGNLEQCRFALRWAVTTTPALSLIAPRDADGEPRAVELSGHPFFVGMLFQPERLALKGENSPVVNAFVNAAVAFATYG